MHEHVAAGAGAARAAALRPRCTGAAAELRRAAHQTLAKVSDDIGRRRVFNTAIAAVMELLNAVGALRRRRRARGRAVRQEALEIAVLCLSPMVPHVCHVLWQASGHERALIDEPLAAAGSRRRWCRTPCEIVVQVNGKLRGRVSVPAGADEAAARAAALADEGVQQFVGRDKRRAA